jgi:hypothetical protein
LKKEEGGGGNDAGTLAAEVGEDEMSLLLPIPPNSLPLLLPNPLLPLLPPPLLLLSSLSPW